MAQRYALIDLENVQPESLQKLKKDGYRIRVFVGSAQNKISVALAAQLQSFGSDAQYIQIEGAGKNALDFHIAFYMGKITATEPGSQFLVISRDTGYDPLLKHLRDQGITANRSGAPSTTPKATKVHASVAKLQKSPSQMSLAERAEYACNYLNKAGKAKPAKLKTLTSAMTSVFQKKLDQASIGHVINELIKKGIVSESQGLLTYKLTQ